MGVVKAYVNNIQHIEFTYHKSLTYLM